MSTSLAGSDIVAKRGISRSVGDTILYQREEPETVATRSEDASNHVERPLRTDRLMGFPSVLCCPSAALSRHAFHQMLYTYDQSGVVHMVK